jgi:hypothetical protein
MEISLADAPFFAFCRLAAIMPAVRNHMNKVIFAKDAVSYSLLREGEMLKHCRRLAGSDANYRFYRLAMVAAPVLMLCWVLARSWR